jgi:hypothetical protein
MEHPPLVWVLGFLLVRSCAFPWGFVPTIFLESMREIDLIKPFLCLSPTEGMMEAGRLPLNRRPSCDASGLLSVDERRAR